MSFTYRMFDSIDEVASADWQRVRRECGEPISMDPRLIAAVEVSMRQTCKFWHIIVYDEGLPVACASLSAITLDLADFADPRLAAIVRRLPAALSRFRNLKVLVCGLPGSAGQHSLAIVSRSISGQILALLDGVICELAAAGRMNGIVYQEFGEDDWEWMKPMLDLGYQRIATPPMHYFAPMFDDFQDYCSALKSRYRQQVNRSVRKLAQTGVEISILTDPDEIVKAYTPEVHDLYCRVVDKADVKPERLPIAFFHELAGRLQGELDLIVLSKDSRIVAFGWGLRAGSAYHMLFDGLDYDLNAECDLYFNLMYAGLDHALRKRVSTIHVGQAANAFKARLGCYSQPLYAFAKGLGPLMSRVVRYGSGLLMAQKPAIPPSDVFKTDVMETLRQAGTHGAGRQVDRAVKRPRECTTSLS